LSVDTGFVAEERFAHKMKSIIIRWLFPWLVCCAWLSSMRVCLRVLRALFRGTVLSGR